jgi:hypothetical protein
MDFEKHYDFSVTIFFFDSNVWIIYADRQKLHGATLVTSLHLHLS